MVHREADQSRAEHEGRAVFYEGLRSQLEDGDDLKGAKGGRAGGPHREGEDPDEVRDRSFELVGQEWSN